jgi:DNA polymerase-3 subunit beta
MKTTVSFDIRYLKAAAMAVSTEETLYYLNGVLAEMRDSGQLRLVATDGHRMAIFAPDCESHQFETFKIIVPADVIAKIKINRRSEEQCALSIDTAENRFALSYDGVEYAFTPIDGTFPDYGRFVPQSCDGSIAQFNAGYVESFVKMQRLWGGRGHSANPGVGISHNGGGPALITFWEPDVKGFGVLMPMRGSAMDTPPYWYKEPESAMFHVVGGRVTL